MTLTEHIRVNNLALLTTAATVLNDVMPGEGITLEDLQKIRYTVATARQSLFTLIDIEPPEDEAA